MDENGNGKIHYGEFYLLVLFVTCDKNRDGFITYDEAKYMAGKFDEYSMTVEQVKNDRCGFPIKIITKIRWNYDNYLSWYILFWF